MRIVSVNVGRSRECQVRGDLVRTAIYKDPATGPITVGRLGFDGDEQADLTVHGGANKAVYAYPSEHYAFWREELPDADLPWGAFGENLTTEGLLEGATRIGDRFRIGTAEFVVTQPRMPCRKLAMKFGRADMIKRFYESLRSGFYLSVAHEGQLCAGDAIALVSTADEGATVTESVRARNL